MFTDSADTAGFFTSLIEQAVPANASNWACNCPSCAGANDGQGALDPGAFATTPTSEFTYVSQSGTDGLLGKLDALVAGSKWSSLDGATDRTVVTYSFASVDSTFDYTQMAELTATIASFSEADKALTRSLLDKIAAVCNVEFVEVPDTATECGVLRYAYSQQPNTLSYAGFAFFPAPSATGGDIWIGANQAGSTWDFYRPNLILHETLHALGLKHPFDSGPVLDVTQDIIPNTVMSYSPVAGGTAGWMSDYPSEPMLLDVAALQFLYGAAPTNSGDTAYDLSDAQFKGFSALWDAGGNDTLDGSGVAHALALDLRDGSQSDIGGVVNAMARAQGGVTLKTVYTSTLAIATGSHIENAIGSAFADRITGNADANVISGGGGDDRLEGLAGNDTLDGGAGVDTAVVAGVRGGYEFTKLGTGFSLAGGDTGADTLVDIERIAFSDTRIALDIDGNAGTVAKVIGAVLGSGLVHNAGYVGIGLAALDSGMSVEALVQLAIDARFGDSHSNEDVVAAVCTNLAGFRPGQAFIDTYVHLLDTGACTQAGLVTQALDHPLNLDNIDFTGLAATGIEYSF